MQSDSCEVVLLGSQETTKTPAGPTAAHQDLNSSPPPELITLLESEPSSPRPSPGSKSPSPLTNNAPPSSGPRLKGSQSSGKRHKSGDADQQHGEDIYEKKFRALAKRVEAVRQQNERLIYQVYQTRKLVHKYQHQRRILLDRLSAKHGDTLTENVSYPMFPLPIVGPKQAGLMAMKTESKPKPAVNPSRPRQKPKPKPKPEQTAGGNNGGNGNTSSTSSSAKPEVDPSAPKKPVNPYILYCKDQRDTVLEQYQSEMNSEMSRSELTKVLARNWREMGDNDKKVYYEQYEHVKGEYAIQMREYQASKDANNSSEAKPDQAGGHPSSQPATSSTNNTDKHCVIIS